MDIKQINEILAVNMFSLVPQVDFGKWEEHKWKLDEDGEIDDCAFDIDRHYGPQCERCGYFYCVSCREGIDELAYDKDEPCEKDAPDYTSEYRFWDVLKKLKEKYVVQIEVRNENVECRLLNEYADGEKLISALAVEAESIPLAVCLAAVKSLELGGAKNNE